MWSIEEPFGAKAVGCSALKTGDATMYRTALLFAVVAAGFIPTTSDACGMPTFGPYSNLEGLMEDVEKDVPLMVEASSRPHDLKTRLTDTISEERATLALRIGRQVAAAEASQAQAKQSARSEQVGVAQMLPEPRS